MNVFSFLFQKGEILSRSKIVRCNIDAAYYNKLISAIFALKGHLSK